MAFEKIYAPEGTTEWEHSNGPWRIQLPNIKEIFTSIPQSKPSIELYRGSYLGFPRHLKCSKIWCDDIGGYMSPLLYANGFVVCAIGSKSSSGSPRFVNLLFVRLIEHFPLIAVLLKL